MMKSMEKNAQNTNEEWKNVLHMVYVDPINLIRHNKSVINTSNW